MTMIPDPRWPPRLARLYSQDVRRLEALHANHLSPGTTTWAEAVEALFQKMAQAGPVKGTRLLQKAIDYLDSIDSDERSHFMVGTNCRGRMAVLMLATFSAGTHPDPRVKEDGLGIRLHLIRCTRSRTARVTNIPVAYVSMHAVRRLFERGFDIVETSHATSVFAFIGALGYVSFDGFMFVLRAPREHGDHWVGLEPNVLAAFDAFRRKVLKPEQDDEGR